MATSKPSTPKPNSRPTSSFTRAQRKLWFDAAASGDHQQLAHLLAQGAIVDARCIHGPEEHRITAAMLATAEGHHECLKILLGAGANMELRDRSHLGQTLLLLACSRSNAQCARLLIQAGADVDAVDDKLFTPTIHAALEGLAEVLDDLVKAGARLDETDDAGLDAATYACSRGMPDILQKLIAGGADVRPAQRDPERIHLHLAAMANCVESIDLLLDAGWKVDAADQEGCTPAMLAVFEGSESALLRLAMLGADFSLENKKGENVMDLARRAKAAGCVAIVQSIQDAKALRASIPRSDIPAAKAPRL